jgi:NADH pyrophosphatase NudC (nudix superfamily)
MGSARSTAIEVDHTELEDARWYEKSWLLSHQDDDEFRVAEKVSEMLRR